MARDMIVLEGNVGEEAVPLRVLFLYRDLPKVTDECGNVMVPTPQDSLGADIKDLLEQRELDELDTGVLAAEVAHYETDDTVKDKDTLREWVKYLQRLYWAQRDRFLKSMQDRYCLRGLVIDASEAGGGIELTAVEVR